MSNKYAFEVAGVGSVTTIGDAAFPPGLFIVGLFKREGTSVSTMLDQFSLQELKDNYRSRSGCPS